MASAICSPRDGLPLVLETLPTRTWHAATCLVNCIATCSASDRPAQTEPSVVTLQKASRSGNKVLPAHPKRPASAHYPFAAAAASKSPHKAPTQIEMSHTSPHHYPHLLGGRLQPALIHRLLKRPTITHLQHHPRAQVQRVLLLEGGGRICRATATGRHATATGCRATANRYCSIPRPGVLSERQVLQR